MTPWQISIGNLNNIPAPKQPVGRPVVFSIRDGEKTCSKCHDFKPLDQFRINDNGKPLAACRECEALSAKANRRKVK